jgi:hypothetical protein
MLRTQVVAIIAGLILAVWILEMVRRRRLREEYSWLWLLTAIGYFSVALEPRLADWVARLIGSSNPVSAFTFLGLLFLFLISVQFSVQISRLVEQNKNLVQHIAILDGEIRELVEEVAGANDIDSKEIDRLDAPDNGRGQAVLRDIVDASPGAGAVAQR